MGLMAERRAALPAWLAPALQAAAMLLAGLCAGRGAALAGVAALAPGVVLAAPRWVPARAALGETKVRALAALGTAVGMATVAPAVPAAAMAVVVAMVV